MKRTLYLKLLGGYLLFGLLGFLIIATFTYHLTFQHLEKKEAQNLYRESALISSSYAQNYFSNSMTLDQRAAQRSGHLSERRYLDRRYTRKDPDQHC